MATSLSATPDQMARLLKDYPDAFGSSLGKRARPWLWALGILAYLAFSVWFFNMVSLLQPNNWNRAGLEVLQWVSYETRPAIAITPEKLEVSFNQYDPLGHNPKPDWIIQDGPGKLNVNWGSAATKLSMTGQDATIVYGADTLHFRNGPKGWVLDGAVPDYVHLQEGGARVFFGVAGNVELDIKDVTIRRRFPGWANFWFDPDSKLWGRSLVDLAGLIVSGERVDPAQSNMSLAFDNFWNNSNWQHGDVLTKLLQTIVMAFVGTLFGAIFAFPLAFLAAANITRVTVLNQLTKRYFEFLRCVGLLVWALFFTRGFGPGPLSGISAVFVSEVGLLGKTYTEALENIDNKQREGVTSLGASPVQVQRYGVLPQVLPLFASQALYQWESNTRSATVIGAMGAGGIGLKLLESMRTNSNWANVCYMVLLILVVVYVIDGISTALRRRLIKGSASGS